MSNNFNKQIFKKLVRKYVKGTASEEEILFLNQYYAAIQEQPDMLQHFSEAELDQLRKNIIRNVTNQIDEPEKNETKIWHIKKTKIWLRAAIFIGVVATAALWYLNWNKEGVKQHQITPSLANTNQIVPGGNKAVLTLADGSTVLLDSARDGALAQQGNVKVIKLNDGQLAYQSVQQQQQSTAAQYNTIATPRGGQYKLTLADGTKVWLNAESSLRYPAMFNGNDRTVSLTGEGYFEVAHNASKPFYVQTPSMNIQVLGTHFNVNSYSDEVQQKTTLLEGSIKLSSSRGGTDVVLKPGEQASLQNSNINMRTLSAAELENAVAWKNGFFLFGNSNLKEVMNQIARWYDIDVVYEGAVSNRKFGGGISRDANLSDVLKILEVSDVHFKLSGKKLIVNP